MHITVTDRPVRNDVSDRQMRSKIPEHFQLISNKKPPAKIAKAVTAPWTMETSSPVFLKSVKTKDSAGNNTANRSSIAPVSKKQLESAIGVAQLCPPYPDSATSTIATRPAATAACA